MLTNNILIWIVSIIYRETMLKIDLQPSDTVYFLRYDTVKKTSARVFITLVKKFLIKF